MAAGETSESSPGGMRKRASNAARDESREDVYGCVGSAGGADGTEPIVEVAASTAPPQESAWEAESRRREERNKELVIPAVERVPAFFISDSIF